MNLIEHTHDAYAGVYRVRFGLAITEDIPTGLLDVNGVPMTHPEVVGYEHVGEIVFADDDKRWFRDGERWPVEEVARTQWGIVKAARENVSNLSTSVRR